MKRIYTSLAIIAMAMVSATGGIATAKTEARPAPDFTLKSATGENVKLSELRGQVVMINFWATWCGPCRQEMPLLENLHQQYSPLGFTLLGVNVEKDPEDARRWLKERPVSFQVLFDTNNQVTKQYQVQAMPSTIMIDRDGNVRHVHKGYKPGDESSYQKMIRELVKE